MKKEVKVQIVTMLESKMHDLRVEKIQLSHTKKHTEKLIKEAKKKIPMLDSEVTALEKTIEQKPMVGARRQLRSDTLSFYRSLLYKNIRDLAVLRKTLRKTSEQQRHVAAELSKYNSLVNAVSPFVKKVA